MQINPQTFLVLRVFQSQTSVHASVKPKDFMQFLSLLWEAKWSTPQERTGRVRSVVRYTKRSLRVEHFPQIP